MDIERMKELLKKYDSDGEYSFAENGEALEYLRQCIPIVENSLKELDKNK